MATVEDLVQKLGKPPREICLDWVWQIEHLPIASGIDPDQARKLSMSDLEVDATGQLQIHTQESFSYSTQDLLEKLKLWSVESPQPSLGETMDGAALQENTNNDQQSVVSRIKKPAQKYRRNDKLTIQIAAAAIAVVSLVFAALTWNGNFHFVASHDSGRVSDSDTKQNDDKSKQSTKHDNQTLEDFTLQPSSANAEVETFETLKTPALDVGPSESMDSGLVDLGSRLPDIFASDPKSLDKQGIKTEEEPLPPTNAGAPGAESKEASLQTMAERDVMKEATELAKDASKDAVETDIKESENGSLPNEPIVIQTSPMVQVMKFGSKVPNLSRQSTWNLELMVDDGFVITPSEPQRLKERQTVTWSIAMDEAESPETRLVIAVDIPPWQTSLRWRIAATADDLPQLALPLDPKLLRAMQDRMRFFSLQADSVIESIKQSSSSLPREMRAIATKQRSDLENQSKLAKRLLTIASEASLINDQLHGHVSVRVKLQESQE